jgi:diaminopimelate epimerase
MGFRRIDVDLPLSLSGEFFKGHGHGNDYLVFQEGEAWPVTPETVRLICDRTRGVGGDGIVALLAKGPPFRLRMFNPDGSEFERSGNGLRVLGAYLFGRDRVRLAEPFPVEVGGERVEMEILSRDPGGELNIAVEMGVARFGPEAVGAETRGFEKDGRLLSPSGEALDLHLVSMGNPHCVVLRPSLREEDLLELGPFLTSNPAFPRGINVQLARPTGDREVRILIWERGVGRTTSSGTSACAVASACVRSGLLQPGRIRVVMEGGDFTVSVSPGFGVRLEGPVQPVVNGGLTGEMLERLTTGNARS